ncbi:MAG: flagellar hook-length control protein FliK [Treponema sp.]|nr:flagellar hook-length control protein FliK [Treponema sp.]
MGVSLPNSGFPFAGETRMAGGLGQYYAASGDSPPAGGVEDRSRDFEKVFEEFLSVNRREEREKEAAAIQDREIRGREEAGPQTQEALPPESASPWGPESPKGLDSPRKAEVPRGAEAPGDLEAAGEKDAAWLAALPAGGETLADSSRSPRFGDAPEGESREFREDAGEFVPEDFFSIGSFAPWTFGKSGESSLEARGGTPETVMAEEGGLSAELTEGHTGGEGIPRWERASGFTVKKAPALKNGGGEGTESPVSAFPQKAMDVMEGGPEGSLFEDPAVVRDGKIRPALAEPGERAGEVWPFVSPGYEETGEETSPVIPALVPGPERETEKNREGRGSGRRKLELRDYREKPSAELSFSLSPESPEQSSGQSKIEIHPELLSRDFIPADINARGSGERAAGNGGRIFEDMLARELQQNLNSDIVRHAQLVLRDKGEGLIRLSLRPESLGNVKIRLELTENKIAGRIIVESGEALRAFEREIASLEQAFKDSGYESAELSAFLSQDGRDGGREEGKPFYSPRFALDRARYDEIVERMDTSFSGLSENGLGPGNGHIQINMLI